MPFPPRGQLRWSPSWTGIRTRWRPALYTIYQLPVASLGVTKFGESGWLDEVCRLHEIDTDAITGAVLDLVD